MGAFLAIVIVVPIVALAIIAAIVFLAILGIRQRLFPYRDRDYGSDIRNSSDSATN